jgi:putative membrane protein
MSLAAIVIGLVLGFLSGLIPGIHPNFVVSVLDSLGMDSWMPLMIISMYGASLVVSFIPSIFFGIPEDASVVSALAGQRFALKGRGLAALKTMILSAVAAALMSSAMFLLSIDFYGTIYPLISRHIKYLLLVLAAALVLRSRSPVRSLLVFVSAGILGKITFDIGLEDPFLPLFSGMFAVSSIISAGKNPLPPQKEEPAWRDFPKFSALGVGLGLFANLLPGIGSPAQIAAVATLFIPLESLQYLAAVSAISVSQAVFSLSSAASIGKARNGVVAWLAENYDVEGNLGILLAVFVMSMICAAAIVYFSRKHIAKIDGLDFSAMGKIIAAYIFSITFIVDGTAGVAILVLSSLLGFLTVRMGAERISLMGSIILPTLMLLFGIFI